MIKQAATGLNSRNEANPFNEDGFLPLITAPMYSVVDDSNYELFLDNKIQVCLPRGNFSYSHQNRNKDAFYAMSLNDFIQEFITDRGLDVDMPAKVCVDTANGNVPTLHDAIRKAKEIHGDNLTIMAGNVASVEAFVELAKTGVDYIRVGIGGGGGCNTTSNTGVGQWDLSILIDSINLHRNHPTRQEVTPQFKTVKIVADGISSYIKYCQDKYRFNDNGYAAINKLLFAGADLVMIGKLFAQCVESAGDKGQKLDDEVYDIDFDKINEYFNAGELVSQYAGMSTQAAQKTYRLSESIKPSEGSVSWIPVRWTLNEWLNGSQNQDESPYLMGWVNSIRSAMSYTGKKSLK